MIGGLCCINYLIRQPYIYYALITDLERIPKKGGTRTSVHCSSRNNIILVTVFHRHFRCAPKRDVPSRFVSLPSATVLNDSFTTIRPKLNIGRSKYANAKGSRKTRLPLSIFQGYAVLASPFRVAVYLGMGYTVRGVRQTSVHLFQRRITVFSAVQPSLRTAQRRPMSE